jgi:hypothetical protein
MKIDVWNNMYPSQWKGKIVPDAITHPAKYSSKLIRRIYEHMLEEGWLQPGDLVIDPFGGVALGALDAMRLGLRWRGVELEPHFQELGNQNIGLWNSKFSRMPGWCTDATLLQGDSRHLLEVLGMADGNVSSPPFADSLSNDGVDADARRTLARELGISNAEHVSPIDMEKIGKRSKGYGVVSSPPYADGAQHTGGDDPHPERMEGGVFHDVGLDGMISSPPYAESDQNYKEGWKRFHDHHEPLWTNDRQREAWYGVTTGQLGAMKADGFDAAVASPPFRQASGGSPEPKPGGPIDEALYKRHAAGNSAAGGYGESDGQLANMGEGDFDGAVSSPPFENNLSHDGRGYDDLKIAKDLEISRHRTYKGSFLTTDYGSMDGNIGNNSGDDFWQAARTIVEQVYLVLRPGAHAVWVVKGFVKNKQLVDFPGQWRQLCEAVGFVAVHEHHAMLVHGKQHDFERGIVNQTESKSFFRRLAEKKGSPRIDFETIICMVK